MGRAKDRETRNYILYLILTLKKYSDKEHPLTITEITNKLNTEFQVECGGNIDRTTVRRMLIGLSDFIIDEDIDESSDKDFVNDIHNAGFYLGFKKKANADQYYYESAILESELLVLCRAMETYHFFASSNIESITEKLANLRPLSNSIKYIPTISDERIKLSKENDALLEIIRDIAKIIHKGSLAYITYGTYDTNFELQINKNRSGEVLPLRLLAANGYYYLVVLTDNEDYPYNLRVDRIISIEEVEKPDNAKEIKEYEKRKKKFTHTTGGKEKDKLNSSSEYRNEHPIMYAGDKERFKILINTSARSIMNTLLDCFGNENKLKKADDKLLKKYHLKDEWMVLNIKSAPGGVELFAKEYCQNVIIVEPKESADRVKNDLQQTLNRYKLG